MVHREIWVNELRFEKRLIKTVDGLFTLSFASKISLLAEDIFLEQFYFHTKFSA